MQIIFEKLYYRVQSLLVFLQKKMIARELGLLRNEKYRIDLLRTMQRISAAISHSDIVVDVGANKGEFAQIFSDVYHPGLCICVEPNSALNEDIRRHSKPETIIINKAVSDTEGEMEFFLHPDSQMSSLFPSDSLMLRRDFGEDDPDGIVKEMVPVTTLDLLYSEYSDKLKQHSVFLKIDTQGNELEVLKGGQSALALTRYVLLEYMFQSPYKKRYPFEQIVALMAANGFACVGPMHISYRSTGEAGAVLFLFEKIGSQQ